MFKVIKNFQCTVEAVADDRADIQEASTEYGAGSTCFVIEDSSVWMLGNDDEWHEI